MKCLGFEEATAKIEESA